MMQSLYGSEGYEMGVLCQGIDMIPNLNLGLFFSVSFATSFSFLQLTVSFINDYSNIIRSLGF